LPAENRGVGDVSTHSTRQPPQLEIEPSRARVSFQVVTDGAVVLIWFWIWFLVLVRAFRLCTTIFQLEIIESANFSIEELRAIRGGLRLLSVIATSQLYFHRLPVTSCEDQDRGAFSVSEAMVTDTAVAFR
jgi:hypothetical protein